jgi:hypothetical protein
MSNLYYCVGHKYLHHGYYQSTKLTRSTDTILFLISQELKIRRLFIGLQKVGVDECYFEPYLDRLILPEMGLDETNETMERYCRVMEKRSRKIKPNEDSIKKQSLKAYVDLVGKVS